MTLAAAGIALGVPATFVMGRITRPYLAGIRGTDSITLSAGAITLAAVMVLACWIPSRRVARIDPLDALRQE
jgi:ABC-type antimicrobial peptide transport system permease subunit